MGMASGILGRIYLLVMTGMDDLNFRVYNMI